MNVLWFQTCLAILKTIRRISTQNHHTMTIQEFNNTRFGNGDKAIYNGQEYDISSVDFVEALVGIEENIPGAEPEEISWKRCENITYVPKQR